MKKPAFVWSELYSVGHPVIDEQHKRMLQIIERMDALSARPEGTIHEEFHSAVNDFFEAANKHLLTEEQLLAGTSRTRLAEHQAEHSIKIEQLIELLGLSSPTMPDTQQLGQRTYSWWMDHLIKDIKDFEPASQVPGRF